MSGSNSIDDGARRVRYEADAMYLRLRDGTVVDTVEIEEMVDIDVDADGWTLGSEFVVASDFLAFLKRRGGELVVPAHLGTAIAVPPQS